MTEVINESQEELQDSMWIEIIERMENLYAELANNQAEIERKNQELSQTKDFIEDVVKSMVDALMVIDSQGKIKMLNRAFLELLGYKEEEIMGKPAEMIFAEVEGKKLLFKGTYVEKLIKEGFIKDFEMDFRSKEGEKIPMTFSGSMMKNSQGEIIGIIGVAKDLRETKRLLAEAAAAEAERTKAAELERAYKELQELQAQLIHSEKLASLGRLAAGVAHEINNPLTGVLTFAHLLSKRVPKDNRWKEDLGVIVKEATRCKRIIKGLLDFARQTEPEKVWVDINKIIEKSLSLVENQASFQNIKIVKELAPVLPEIMVDANQIHQVFMNIILNAQEAMPEEGFLTVASDLIDGDQWIEVKFIDTGCGISEENMDKLFDPFFTTKETDKGTGLGLAVSYGIMERHQGTIEVESRLGKGTTFIIKLPVTGKEKR